MKAFNNYILEKLKLNKDLSLPDNKYCNIYDINEGDLVLCLCKSPKKSQSFINYVYIYPAIIHSINDDKITVKNAYNGNIVDRLEYTFENPYHSSPHILKTFAFWRNNNNWSALMKKDEALKIIDKQLSANSLNFIGGFRLDPGIKQTKKQLLEKIKNTLENN